MEDELQTTSRGPTSDKARSSGLDLYWIPLGAGAKTVRRSGKAYEALSAGIQRRGRCDLYHSALVATDGGDRVVIEMTPVPDSVGREDRGVVSEGPVGTRWARRLRVFRYEIRRWRNGVIPDLSSAVESPVRITDDPQRVRSVLDLVPSVPTPVWGRDELHGGEMWNSNSVTAWLLTRAGLIMAAGRPPCGGRAPGWDAGVTTALRSGVLSARPEESDLVERRSAGDKVLVGLELLTGILGLAGGLMLVARPDGSLLQARMSALSGSPFHDWRIPGVLLSCLVGGGFVLAGLCQARRLSHARALSMFAGTGLIAFELSELVWIGFQPLEAVFWLVGAAVAILAFDSSRQRSNGPGK